MGTPKGPRRKGAEKIAADIEKFEARIKRHTDAANAARNELSTYIVTVKAEMDALKSALPD